MPWSIRQFGRTPRDLNGEAVGITTAMASEDGGFQGIGFAIPASLVKKLVADATECIAKKPLRSRRGREVRVRYQGSGLFSLKEV